MACLHVYKYKNPNVPYVLDVQADLLGGLHTRVVVPLIPYERAANEVLSRLKPVIHIGKEKLVMMTTDMATIKTSDLGEDIGSIEGQRHEITQALDFLFQGF